MNQAASVFLPAPSLQSCDRVILDELVEADETYILESQKGVKCESRKPRKHGEGATKRGLSKEQYCVCVASDRSDNLVATCVNRAKPSGDDLVNALSSHIIPQSVLLCDGATAYNQLAEFHGFRLLIRICQFHQCGIRSL